MEYIFGNPNKAHSWENVVSVFAATHSLHSETTSSLPLVQFWKPKRHGLKKVLVDACRLDCKGRDVEKYCFEYPVPVHPKCGGRGKASMTDLMIITSSYVVAIEAKYTEYLCGKQESISQWLNNPSEGRDETISANRKKVLQGWLSYIVKKGCAKQEQIDGLLGELSDVPYQLFHRIASACAASLDPKRKPVVIYQVFCDEKEKAEDFSRITKGYFDVLAKTLDLQNVDFHVVITPVTNKPESGTCKADLGQLFLRMLEKDHDDIFEFGKTILFKG